MKTLCLLLAVAPSLAFADHCAHEADRNLDIPREGAKVVAFDLSSADVEVEGVAGMSGVEVRGRACASSESRLADMTLQQRREGDRIVVVAREEQHGGWSMGYTGFRIKVRVPPELAVAIESSSGDAKVRNVASLVLDASSGDLQVNDVAGPVSLSLSSGDVQGDHIGPLTVKHVSSGDITVRDIRGDVDFGSIGSGDIKLVDVHGQVTIDHSSSGDITLRDVDRDVRIGRVSSGDIDIDGVGGNLTLASRHDDDDVEYKNVKGRVTFSDTGG